MRVSMAPDGRSSRRWIILALLVGFSAIAYVERVNLSVAGRFMREDLQISDIEIGWIFSSFLLAYTLAQIPAGLLVDRLGPHRVLTWAAFSWFLLTLVTALAAEVFDLSGVHAVIVLVLLRFALGLAEAPTYPAATRAVANWFAPSEQAKANSIIQAASYGGFTITMPFMAAGVILFGWQGAVMASAAPALLLGIAWWIIAREKGGDPPSPKTPAANAGQSSLTNSEGSSRLPLREVGLLSTSYFFHGAVGYLFFFWFFSYLVEERGFSIAQSGWVASLPTAAAALFALVGGWFCGSLAGRLSLVRAGKLIILASAVLGAGALLIGTFAASAELAIAGFVVAIALHGFVEATYWTLAIELGRGGRAGLVAGSMNSMSNLGGVVATALAPVAVHAFGWSAALAIAAVARAIAGTPTLFLRELQSPRGIDG